MSLLLALYNAFKDHHRSADRDPRIQDLPIVSNFPLLCGIVFVYALFVLKLGPAFMAKRKPYNITGVIQTYNCVQIVINLWIFGGSIYYLRHPQYSWFCMNVDKSDASPETMIIRTFSYTYFISKLLDLLETVFFVLRKKSNQVSFLHLYHHIIMIYGTTIYMNFLFATHFTIVGVINSLIHVVMYVYYFLAARKEYKHRLAAWKPRMTQLQILQFFYVFIKFFFALVNNTCGLPYFWLWITLTQNVVMVVLFSHFYWKNYIVKAKKVKET